MNLSNLTLIDEDDIVPASGVEPILNAEFVNTLPGDDRITGIGNDYSFKNVSVLDIDDGNDTITGIEDLQPNFGSSYDIVNSGMLNRDEDNDILTGILRDDAIVNSGKLNTDEDNDILTGIASRRDSYGTSKLKIHSIRCTLANADPIGPDDTYIEINGCRIWGDYNMRDWWWRSVDYSVEIPEYSAMPWVELFDADHGWSSDDSLGGFTPQANTGGRETMQRVGNYEVYYSSYGSARPLDYRSGETRGYRSGETRNTSGGTRDYTSGGTRGYTSGGTRSYSIGQDYTSGGTRDYSIGQDYTSGGTRDYSIGQDYTSGGTRGGNVLMPIQP
jgi:hypothetical protein